MTETIVEPRTSALICWPVQQDGPHNVRGMHCTAAYLPEVRHTKEDILASLRYDSKNFRSTLMWGSDHYRHVKVTGAAAFGPESSIPVLLLDGKELHDRREGIVTALTSFGIPYSDEYTYQPHVTVSLFDALNPVSYFLLRPLELWYKDDDPVVV